MCYYTVKEFSYVNNIMKSQNSLMIYFKKLLIYFSLKTRQMGIGNVFQISNGEASPIATHQSKHRVGAHGANYIVYSVGSSNLLTWLGTIDDRSSTSTLLLFRDNSWCLLGNQSNLFYIFRRVSMEHVAIRYQPCPIVLRNRWTTKSYVGLS